MLSEGFREKFYATRIKRVSFGHCRVKVEVILPPKTLALRAGMQVEVCVAPIQFDGAPRFAHTSHCAHFAQLIFWVVPGGQDEVTHFDFRCKLNGLLRQASIANPNVKLGC
ncbi:MAG: hypothetical protein A3E79_03215 [Burkholderiales bacterium RIFCSPHIGHO2_12_FULL_61_11]|nr:MAG: hypothetical protein A3E79_03215 [Burkholderiales bacterium RIFCSPHIGHO2_12_FULL_61_11]